MHRFAIIGILGLLVGCSTNNPVTSNQRLPSPADFDTSQWRWEDYSNRVWLHVSGVGIATGPSNILKQVNFSYSPSTGKSEQEAIAIMSFNMFSGHRDEHFLLRVLYGSTNPPLDCSNVISNGKVLHIYRFTTGAGETNTVFFDGTKYHNVW